MKARVFPTAAAADLGRAEGSGAGSAGPRLPEPPGRRGSDGAWSGTARLQSVAVRLLLAPGECAACSPSAARAEPGGRGDARSSEPRERRVHSSATVSGPVARCVQVTVGLLPGGLSGRAGVCWHLENQAVMLAFVSQASSLCHRAECRAELRSACQAWQRPCHCGRAHALCVRRVWGAACSDYRESLSVGVLRINGVLLLCVSG